MGKKRNRFGGLSIALEFAIVSFQLNPWFQMMAFMPAIIGVAASAQSSAKC
jgi:hypothetical protein